MSRTEDRPRVDVLFRKHECGPSLSRYRPLDLVHEGRSLRVSIPDNLRSPERLEIRATLVSDDLAVLIGRHSTPADDPDERGVLMVAKRADGGEYVVHVWHELYPWALDYLGLAAK